MWILMEAQGYSLEKAMAPHSSTLAWKIPRTEEPGGLQSMGLLRVGHDWVTSLSHFHFSLSCIGEGNGNPLQCSCLENPRDRGAWWAAVYGVAQSRTRLKRLSSSSRATLSLTLCVRLQDLLKFPEHIKHKVVLNHRHSCIFPVRLSSYPLTFRSPYITF